LALLRSLCLAGLVGLAAATPSLARDLPLDYEVKAAYLYKLSLFVRWPETAFSDSKAPLIVGVVGQDPFGAALDGVLAGKKVRGRPLVVKRFAGTRDLGFSHVLFIAENDRAAARQVIRQLKDSATLTVGETGDFISDGGVIQFVMRKGMVRFRVNNEHARLAGLKVSAKLLQLSE
jgi:hypothetical protein